ncbi:MAG: ribonuclease HII [Gammaproteobacteria bacterium]|nr:ribonuclease HII [Gammaproteobacteria bacterium]
MRIENALEGTVCGVDEVGYSPVAGPVVAAAVVLPRGQRSRRLAGLRDSKQLSRERRERFFAEIDAIADVSVAEASVAEIDQLNIYQANRLAMARAVAGLNGAPDVALVDGHFKPDLPCRFENLIKGDERSLSIACASIMAKVTRDRFMTVQGERYPGYAWASNVGYGTEAHHLGLLRFGPTPLHRRSFAPLNSWVTETRIDAFRFVPIVRRVCPAELFELRAGLVAVFDTQRRHLGMLTRGAQGWRIRAYAYTDEMADPAVGEGPLGAVHNRIVREPGLAALTEVVRSA